MRTPHLTATVGQRLLLNYRADPEIAAVLLPAGLRPRLVDGAAVVGICILRLEAIRPAVLPAAVGLDTDNAAHRIGVEWDTPDGVESGVYVPRRMTTSRVTSILGGRLFPGVHDHVVFSGEHEGGHHSIALRSRSGQLSIRAEVTETDAFRSAIFDNLGHASAYFETAPVGWSPDRHGRLEGMRMTVSPWAVRPLRIDSLRSSWFDDHHRFPVGSLELDSGLIMGGMTARWQVIDERPQSALGAASTSSLTSSAAGAARCIS